MTRGVVCRAQGQQGARGLVDAVLEQQSPAGVGNSRELRALRCMRTGGTRNKAVGASKRVLQQGRQTELKGPESKRGHGLEAIATHKKRG